jgi:hypothetical protein
MKRVAVLRNHALSVSVALNTKPTNHRMVCSLDHYSPTFAAAFSRNSEESLMYRRTIALDLWPVWAMMLRSLAPAIAAEVASPARRL